MITYCVVHWNRLDELQKCIRRHSPHVDRTIIVDGKSTDGSLEWLTSQEAQALNVQTIVRPWDDNPPGARNAYLEAAGNDGWVLVTDSDEYLEDAGAYSIRDIVKQAEKDGTTLVKFNAHDIMTNIDGSVWENKTTYYNPMLFKMGPTVRYHGHTHVGVSTLPGKIVNSSFRYFHIKSVPDQWIRGARNYWTTSAVAANVRDAQWQHFKNLCNNHGLHLFADMFQLMKAGTVPQDLLNWMIQMKDSTNSEIRSYFVCYLVIMHPELNPGISNSDFPYQANRPSVLTLRF